jgi:hypothetical protein
VSAAVRRMVICSPLSGFSMTCSGGTMAASFSSGR